VQVEKAAIAGGCAARAGQAGGVGSRVVCSMCDSDGCGKSTVERVALPYVFRYLATELAAMNIKCTLATE
jgi:DNA-directed RNA polymerase I subunit RPA2